MSMIEVKKELVDGVIKDIVKAQVLTGLAEQKEKIMEEMITLALFQKCDSNGNVSQYRSDNNYTIIDVLFRKAVFEAAKEAITEYVQGNKKELVKNMKARISKSPNKFVDMMFKGMEDSLGYEWNFKINVKESDD
jgi:Cu/Ag efflux pump CusA